MLTAVEKLGHCFTHKAIVRVVCAMHNKKAETNEKKNFSKLLVEINFKICKFFVSNTRTYIWANCNENFFIDFSFFGQCFH